MCASAHCGGCNQLIAARYAACVIISREIETRGLAMNKGISLTAVLLLTSAPAFAQAPVGGVDGTLGNGNVESQAPWIHDPVTTSSTRVVRAPAPNEAWIYDDVPASPVRPYQGGVDGTLGNGNVPSQAPWIR
jgi:hypothetical protein